MKKNFIYYFAIWVLLLAIFNVVVFVTPAWQSPSFWVGYVFVCLSFLGQLFCTWLVFQEANAQKRFYNLSLVVINNIGLFLMVALALVFMLVAVIPSWVAAIVCPVILAINFILLLKAKLAADIVSEIDESVARKTAFIQGLKVEAESLMVRATKEDVKAELKRVYEAFKYSDPMSSNALYDVEEQIKIRFEMVKQAVQEAKEELLFGATQELFALLAERNAKCKELK